MMTIKPYHIIDDLAVSEYTYKLIRQIENLVGRISNIVKQWSARTKSRRQLAIMSDYLLTDIGLTPTDVAIELKKHFWQR